MYMSLRNMVNMEQGRDIYNWAKGIKSILYEVGHYEVWEDGIVYDKEKFLYEFTQRLYDNMINSIHVQIAASTKFQDYLQFKPYFEYECYLDSIINVRYRKIITQFRLSSHNLEIERGRHSNVARERRICKLCNLQAIENEYHFLLDCPYYNDLRKKYILIFYISNNSVFHFCKLMSQTKNTGLMQNIGKYLMFAFKRRSDGITVHT